MALSVTPETLQEKGLFELAPMQVRAVLAGIAYPGVKETQEGDPLLGTIAIKDVVPTFNAVPPGLAQN
jgi:hypothetical protein